MKNLKIFAILLLLTTFFACKRDLTAVCPECVKPVVQPCKFQKNHTDTKVWTYFMLWYETSGNTSSEAMKQWGKETPRFRHSPLIGEYESSDLDVLEYQLLLMKYAGIDGIVADVYGSKYLGDHHPTMSVLDALFTACKKTGIELAICYEDRFVTTGEDNPEEAIDIIKDDMEYLQEKYFTSTIYSKIENKPLLLIFGPKTPDTDPNTGLFPDFTSWRQCFETLPVMPAFYPLERQVGDLVTNNVAKSFFFWLNNNEGNSGTDDFYTKEQYERGDIDNNIFVATPGYNNIKWNALIQDYFRKTPYNGGETFQNMLDAAHYYKPEYLQIATWNNYEDGTMIEPAELTDIELNGGNPYVFLEKLQDFFDINKCKNFNYVFPEIYDLYKLRIKYKGNWDVNFKLDRAFKHFKDFEPDEAIEILNEIE